MRPLYSEKEQFDFYHSRLCKEKYSSYESFKNGVSKMGMSLPIAESIIKLSGETKVKAGKFTTSYSNYCGATYDVTEYRERFKNSQNIISKELSQSWLKCHEAYVDAYIKIHSLGAYIDVTPADDWRKFTVVVKNDKHITGAISIRHISPSSDVLCYRASGKKVIPGKTKIDSNSFLLDCTKHPTESVYFKIETNAGISNTVYVPSETSKIVRLQEELSQTSADIDTLRGEILNLRSEMREPRIKFKHFAYVNGSKNVNPTKFNTGFKFSEYIVGIVGFDTGSGDIQEHDAGPIMYVKPVRRDPNWWIDAQFRTHKNHANYSIWVIAVPRNMVESSY